MTTVDELDAIRALAARLTDWGVDGAADKAKLYVGDMVSRGWAMQANTRPIRRPPVAGSNEECRTHIGEWRDFCRLCAADRKAQADEAALPSGRWTPERIREDIATVRAAVEPTPTPRSPSEAAGTEPSETEEN